MKSHTHKPQTSGKSVTHRGKGLPSKPQDNLGGISPHSCGDGGYNHNAGERKQRTPEKLGKASLFPSNAFLDFHGKKKEWTDDSYCA